MKKRIVIFSLGFTPWVHGAEMTAVEITKRLKDRFDFYVITYRFSSDVARHEVADGVNVIRIGPTLFFGKFIWPFLAALKARRLKPDLTHAVFESYPGAALLLFRLLTPSTPTLLTLQSGNIDDPRMRYGLIQKFGRFFLWKLIHRIPHRLTALSQALAQRAKALGVPAERISIIPNGVDLSKIPQTKEKRGAGQIVSVGRLSQEKGFSYLVDAFVRVKEKVPEAKLDIIGEGPEREKIELQIAKLNLETSVRLLGSLPHDEVIRAMRKAELFVLPSVAEGLGIVFIEAQACGTPVIGTNVGGIPDVIIHEETGLLVPPRDAQALAQAMVMLLENKALAQRLATEAQQQASRFAWPRIVESYDQLYKELITKVSV